MSKIKIKTITEVHIGSGELLYENNDFCVGRDSEKFNVIGIIDPRKVMNLIGVEHIVSWVQGIESKRKLGDIVHQYAPKATIEDYSSRIIDLFTSNATETLKEYIHDGLGRPYIPGSSIKGAIRTAVLASLTADIQPERWEILNDKGQADASVMEKNLFGDCPNLDVFRFLHVGDAIFGDLQTGAIDMVNINEREAHSFWDTSKRQTIEVLGAEDETTFEIRMKLDNYRNSKGTVGELPLCMTSLPLLFDAINTHTQSLMESEIEYWAERIDRDESDKVSDYIRECRSILSQTRQCVHGKSCILRIGHGSGWRFITGAWSERSPLFDSKVIPAARPHYEKYMDYDFPKSRRVSFDGKRLGLLGFVKLTIVEE